MNEYAANKLKRVFENSRIFREEITNLEMRIVEYNFYIRDPNNKYDKEALQSSIEQMQTQIVRLNESIKNEEKIANDIMNDPTL